MADVRDLTVLGAGPAGLRLPMRTQGFKAAEHNARTPGTDPRTCPRSIWLGICGAVPGEPIVRAQLSFAAMWGGECAFMVALGVVAFREGGVGAVGAVTAARMACAGLIAPLLASLAASAASAC